MVSTLPKINFAIMERARVTLHVKSVKCKREDILAAESSAGDYNQLANALLDIVFEEELQTPDKYCCTISKGKEMLNEDKMRGIRSKFVFYNLLSIINDIIHSLV